MNSGSHVQPPLVLEPEEIVVDPDNVVGVSGERRPQHGRHADRVLIHMRFDVLGPDRVLMRLQRHDPGLQVEVATELLPDHVHVTPEHEVRAVARPAGGFAAFAPLPLQRQSTEHDRLRRPLRPRACRL